MINIFEAELEKGTGIPYLLIKNKVIEVSPEVDSILLNNILKCTAYDPQCEGLRAEYMFSILSNYQNKEKIYKEVFQAFNIMTDTDWAEQQIFEFVCKIINEKKYDKKILYNKIRYYIENGKDDLYTMYSFVEKEGLRAIEFMARECGKYVEKHPNYEFYYYDGFFQDFDNQHTPTQSIGVCCSHKVVAVGFNTLCYDAERRGIKPSARIKMKLFRF